MTPHECGRRFSISRLFGLVYKESLQVIRDPSAILVTFALPTVMMLVFAFALSLDQTHVPIGGGARKRRRRRAIARGGVFRHAITSR